MATKDRTVNKRMDKLREKKRALGLRPLTEWVPEDRYDDLKAMLKEEADRHLMIQAEAQAAAKEAHDIAYRSFCNTLETIE